MRAGDGSIWDQTSTGARLDAKQFRQGAYDEYRRRIQNLHTPGNFYSLWNKWFRQLINEKKIPSGRASVFPMTLPGPGSGGAKRQKSSTEFTTLFQ
jgi:hypothetical protein